MAGQFLCPHCGASYPIKPVLVGRAVRCTSCKQPFRLRDDGIAEPVGAAAVAPSPSSAPAAAEPAAPATREPPAPAAAAKARGATGDGSSQARKTAVLNRKQEQLRRTMSSTLKDAAAKALDSESVKRESVRLTKKAKKGTKSQRRGEGGRGDISPAILTGEGAAQARLNRVLAYGAGIAVVAVLVLWLVLSGGDPAKEALRDYAAARPGERSDSGRMLGLRRRLWLTDSQVPLIANLNRAEPGAQRRYPLAPAEKWITTTLAPLAYQRDLQMWMSRDARALYDRQPATFTPADRLAVLAKEDHTVIPADAVAPALEQAGLAAEAAAILAAFLHGSTDMEGNNWIRDRLLKGHFPRALEVCAFHGRDGRLLRPGNPSFDIDRYHGRLVRFDGWGGERDDKDVGTWNVFDISLEAAPGAS